MGFAHRSRSPAQTTNERTYDVLPKPDIFQSYRHPFFYSPNIINALERALSRFVYDDEVKKPLLERHVLRIIADPGDHAGKRLFEVFKGFLGKPLAFPDYVPQRPGEVFMLVCKFDHTLVDRVHESLRMQAFKPALLTDIVELWELAEACFHPSIFFSELS